MIADLKLDHHDASLVASDVTAPLTWLILRTGPLVKVALSELNSAAAETAHDA
jgi:hypothetical protein